MSARPRPFSCTDFFRPARERRLLVIKPVVQQDKTGCGIASVAALAGVPYQRVRRAAQSLGISVDDPRLWSDTIYVRWLLRRFRISASPRQAPFRSWQALPNLAMLAIKWHKENGKPFWHWTVFVREGQRSWVVDPKKALDRKSVV